MIGWLTFIFLAVSVPALGSWEFNSKNEVSQQLLDQFEKSEKFSRTRGRSDNEIKWNADTWSLQAALGGWAQREDSDESELTQAYLGFSWNSFSLKAGYQTVSWGQSFAFYVADLANPKDLRDPFVLEPLRVNRAQPMLNLNWFWSSGGLQLLFSPGLVKNKYARSGTRYDFLKTDFPGVKIGDAERNDPRFSDTAPELGGKINFTLSSGLELTAFGLQHWSRVPTSILKLQNAETKLVPVEFIQQSYGLGFSKDFNSWVEGLVLRGDWVYHSRFPRAVNNLSEVSLGNAYDLATGLDWSSSSGLVLGLQILNHIDQVDKKDLLTTRLNYRFWRDRLEFTNLITAGLNTSDVWVQTGLNLSPESHLQILFLIDFIQARGDDPASLYRYWRDLDRYSLEAKILF